MDCNDYAKLDWVFTGLGFGVDVSFGPSRRRKKLVTKANDFFRDNHTKIVNSLKSVDYLHNDYLGAIGIDIENSQLSILNKVGNQNAQPLVFNTQQIESYGVTVEGYSTWESIGSSSLSDTSEMARKNELNRVMAATNTGLYIILNDIQQPQLLAPMAKKYAEEWARLIKKLLDNTLETPQNRPVQFPTLNV